MSIFLCTKSKQKIPRQKAITNGNFIQLDPLIFSIFYGREKKKKNGLKENVFLL